VGSICLSDPQRRKPVAGVVSWISWSHEVVGLLVSPSDVGLSTSRSYPDRRLDKSAKLFVKSTLSICQAFSADCHLRAPTAVSDMKPIRPEDLIGSAAQDNRELCCM
jgi:hypothetical protein